MGSAQRTRVCACLCGKKARNRLVVKQSKARDRQVGRCLDAVLVAQAVIEFTFQFHSHTHKGIHISELRLGKTMVSARFS
jgi:hypothetical protein